MEILTFSLILWRRHLIVHLKKFGQNIDKIFTMNNIEWKNVAENVNLEFKGQICWIPQLALKPSSVTFSHNNT